MPATSGITAGELALANCSAAAPRVAFLMSVNPLDADATDVSAFEDAPTIIPAKPVLPDETSSESELLISLNMGITVLVDYTADNPLDRVSIPRNTPPLGDRRYPTYDLPVRQYQSHSSDPVERADTMMPWIYHTAVN